MNNIKHLIEVLNSQIQLYEKLYSLLSIEKEHIILWDYTSILSLNKEKEELLRQEKVLEHARDVLLSKLLKPGQKNIVLSDLIASVDDIDLKIALEKVGESLIQAVMSVYAENLSVRILYTAHNRLITDFFVDIGLASGSYNGTSKGISTFVDLA